MTISPKGQKQSAQITIDHLSPKAGDPTEMVATYVHPSIPTLAPSSGISPEQATVPGIYIGMGGGGHTVTSHLSPGHHRACHCCYRHASPPALPYKMHTDAPTKTVIRGLDWQEG